MIARWLAGLVTMLILILGSGGYAASAATNTYTATYNNQTRQVYATIPYADSCNPYNPCGALPWMIPRFSTVSLASPTAIATLATPTPIPASVTPSATNTPTETLTPTFTVTGTISTPITTLQAGGEGIETLSAQLGSMAQTLAAQASQRVVIDGTVTAPEQLADRLGSYAGTFFGIVRAYQQMDSFTFGIFGFLLIVLGFVLSVWVATLIGKILLLLMKLVLTIWSSVKPF
jgi:hypothetical protein